MNQMDVTGLPIDPFNGLDLERIGKNRLFRKTACCFLYLTSDFKTPLVTPILPPNFYQTIRN